MKELWGKVYRLYVRYKLWRFRNYVLFVMQNGDVRQIRELAEYFKDVGKLPNMQTYADIGKLMDEKAEQFILGRIDL